jgi:hypothetical protein
MGNVEMKVLIGVVQLNLVANIVTMTDIVPVGKLWRDVGHLVIHVKPATYKIN